MTSSSSRSEAILPGIVGLVAIAGAIGAVLLDARWVALGLLVVAAIAGAAGMWVAMHLRTGVARAIRVCDALGRGDFETRDLEFDQ